MRKHFSLQPAIIVTESSTGCLRLSHHSIEVQIIERYHSCTFFAFPHRVLF
ncbi:hypothetical protein B932_2613 [Gluconobacter oxydans H24]|nr:hypothetical protein B932_2613 [Gluconobacter oxydans H24]